MNSQILDDIYMLNNRYSHDNNTFKIKKVISEEEFSVIMKKFIDNYKTNIKNVEIIDTKNYHDYNNILKISDNGNMKSYTVKNLKFIRYDNKLRLDLYNERESFVNNFNFKQNYDKIFKMKKILFSDDNNNIIEFIVSMEEKDTKNDKDKSFFINIITKSSNINKNIIQILNLLNKND